jgi:hypothetical protein
MIRRIIIKQSINVCLSFRYIEIKFLLQNDPKSFSYLQKVETYHFKFIFSVSVISFEIMQNWIPTSPVTIYASCLIFSVVSLIFALLSNSCSCLLWNWKQNKCWSYKGWRLAFCFILIIYPKLFCTLFFKSKIIYFH